LKEVTGNCFRGLSRYLGGIGSKLTFMSLRKINNCSIFFAKYKKKQLFSHVKILFVVLPKYNCMVEKKLLLMTTLMTKKLQRKKTWLW
jgi:hypothetical protein